MDCTPMTVGANCRYKASDAKSVSGTGSRRYEYESRGRRPSSRPRSGTRVRLEGRSAVRAEVPGSGGSRVHMRSSHYPSHHETHTHHVFCSYMLESPRDRAHAPDGYAAASSLEERGAPARGRGVLTSEQTSVGTDATRTVIHPSSSLTQSFHPALAQRHDVTGEDTLSSRVAGKSYSSTLSVPAAEATCKFRGTNAALGRVWLQDPQRAKRYRHAPKGPRSRPFPPWSGCLPCCSLSQT